MEELLRRIKKELGYIKNDPLGYLIMVGCWIGIFVLAVATMLAIIYRH